MRIFVLLALAMAICLGVAETASAGPIRNLLQNRPRLFGGIVHGCVGGNCNR